MPIDSMVSSIPPEWNWASLSDVAEVSGGVTLGRAVSGPGTVELPYLRVANVQDGYLDLSEIKRVRIFRSEEARYQLKAGDVLMNEGGDFDKLGRGTVWQEQITRCLHQNHVFRVRCRQDSLRPWFLAAICESSMGKSYFVRSSKQTTNLATINSTQLKAFQVPLPPGDEQGQIVEVLRALDATIRKTEQLIAKLEQVKQGLLHDLLTRGIDDNGELRDPDRHPEQFKDSVLGRIPREWEVVRLGDDFDVLHGHAFDGTHFSDRPVGPVILTPGNFHRDGGLYFTSNNTKYYAGRVPSEYVLRNGDLLTVMTDLSPRTLILARAVILEETFEVLHNQRIGKVVQQKPIGWIAEFMCLIMNSPRVRRRVIREATGTTVRHTSPNRILSSLVVQPLLAEQECIVTVVDGYESRIQAELRQASKLRLLKQGLMDDLLTGRVRVTHLLDEPT